MGLSGWYSESASDNVVRSRGCGISICGSVDVDSQLAFAQHATDDLWLPHCTTIPAMPKCIAFIEPWMAHLSMKVQHPDSASGAPASV